jgi:hypothetical protein
VEKQRFEHLERLSGQTDADAMLPQLRGTQVDLKDAKADHFRGLS